jgi:curved DNA-binding protein CbpA
MISELKSHYELLNVPTSANVAEIKKSFRREIARYHPDKVAHLGPELQQMAASRAAELTTAYKTLTDAELRAQYDALLAAMSADAHVEEIDTIEPSVEAGPALPPDRFRQERANRDDILRRAVLERVREAFEQPEYELPLVSGFDLAFVPRGRAVFRRSAAPTVLVRLAAKVDADLAIQAWTDAIRARIPQKPVLLLLLGRDVAPTAQFDHVMEDRRRKHPTLAEEMFPVAIDMVQWRARVPAATPPTVRELIQRLL